MKVVIPDDYQDMVDRLECFALIRHHDVVRYRAPARDLSALVERLSDADVVVAIRERVEFSRALLERLPKLKLIAPVGRNSRTIDFPACTQLGIAVATGESNSPVAPAELTLALILAARRNVALELVLGDGGHSLPAGGLVVADTFGQWPATTTVIVPAAPLSIVGQPLPQPSLRLLRRQIVGRLSEVEVVRTFFLRCGAAPTGVFPFRLRRQAVRTTLALLLRIQLLDERLRIVP